MENDWTENQMTVRLTNCYEIHKIVNARLFYVVLQKISSQFFVYYEVADKHP